MTQEQTDALSRVRAQNSFGAYEDTPNNNYNNMDVGVLLTLLDEETSKVNLVKQDLKDLADYLEGTKHSVTTVAMIKSTIAMIGDGV